jgi:hypothetical protein
MSRQRLLAPHERRHYEALANRCFAIGMAALDRWPSDYHRNADTERIVLQMALIAFKSTLDREDRWICWTLDSLLARAQIALDERRLCHDQDILDQADDDYELIERARQALQHVAIARGIIKPV